MLETTLSLNPALLALIPIVIGLIQVAKMAGLPSKYAPIGALILGVVGALILGGPIGVAILSGLIVGLSASGLYSGVGAVTSPSQP